MFDLVLTDVHMPQIDGFELLEKVQEDFNLPVVMMSADDRESAMLRALECGAAFYLVKPFTMSDLRNLWQFAFATKNMRTTENIGTVMGASIPGKVVGGYMEAASSVNQASSKWEGSDGKVLEKRDEKDEEKTDDSTQEKKARVVWTKILHNHFVDAVNQLGIDKAVPRKILELMNIQGLTRENVASHLQKYRLFLNRDQVTSQSLEPTTAKTLTSGSLMSGQSSLMPDTKRGTCRFPYQPGFGGNIHNLKAPNPMSSLGSACYFNWEAQTSNALFELRYRKSLPSSNQANLEQPLIGTVSSFNEQNDAHYLGFGIGHQFQTSSLIFRDASRGLMGSRDTMQVANEQPQATSRLYSYGPFDNNFSMLGFNDNNNDQNIERTGSYNSINKLTNFNKLPSFNYTRSYAGIQITSAGELVGSSQTGIDHGQPLKDIDYSNKNGNFRGKITHPAAVSSGYASSEGSSSFPIFASASSFPTISTNFIQPPPPPQPPFPPPLQQELRNKYPMAAADHSRLDSIKGCSNVENIYIPQPFDGADLGDLIFKQAVEFPDQQQGGEEIVDADFNISSYKLY